MKKLTLTLTCVLLTFLYSTAQFTVYNTSNSSMPSNYVLTVEPDNIGNLWIGTNAGMAKFDGGTNWTIYNDLNSNINSNVVVGIGVTSTNDKWVGTEGGLSKFDGTTWTDYTSSLGDWTIFSLAMENDDLWVGTFSGGVDHFDGSIWTNYDTFNSNLPNDEVEAIAVDNLGNKWIGTWGGGLAKFDGTTWTIYNTSNSGIAGNNIRTVATESNGDVWIGGSIGGLSKFDGTSWTVYNTSNSNIPGDGIYSIVVDNSGNKWIGTDSYGLAKFDGTIWTVYNTGNSNIPDGYILSLMVDNDAMLWAGTSSGGIAKFNTPTSVMESQVISEDKIQIYPNPSTGSFSLNADQQILSNTTLTITNIQGIELYYENINQHTSGKQVDVSTLPDGVYFIHFSTDQGIQTKKIIIQR